MRKELMYQIVKQNLENSAQGTNVANNQPELTEKSAQEINAENNQTELTRKQCANQ